MQFRRSLALFIPAIAALAQSPGPVLTTADYAHAEKFMTYNTAPLVFRSGVRPTWLAGDRFWYRITTSEGSEFILIDPSRASREPAFDQTGVAASLSTLTSAKYDAAHLPFQQIDFSDDLHNILFNVGQRR